MPVVFEPEFRPSISAVVLQGPSHHVRYRLQKFLIFSINKFHIPTPCSHPCQVSAWFRTDLLTQLFLMFLTSVRKNFQDFQIAHFSYSILMYSFPSCVTWSKNLEPSSGTVL